MPIAIQCQECGAGFNVIPARKDSAKYCSNVCRGKAQGRVFVGSNHPRWLGGAREKACQGCGVVFPMRPKQPYTQFVTQKFCTKLCADEHGFRFEGEAHTNYKPDSRRKSARGKHGAWARRVISRDSATCRHCGNSERELHAHHIKSFADYPELRWDVDNGLTLCCNCHWDVHTASNENAVNSGNILPGNAGGNPEPSHGRKAVEGVTTRGRAFRRVNGSCAWCGVFVSRTAAQAGRINNMFCCKSHSSQHTQKQRAIARRGSNAPTSAARESDDIV